MTTPPLQVVNDGLPVRISVGDNPLVLRRGKIFEVGDYPDKEFALDEAEADAAIAAFAPVQADYEHRKGPLDGKLGRLTRVWREGRSLFGEVELPDWLDAALADTGRKISLAWSHAPQKRIVGWGWVRTPRVTDATLFAAFSAAESTFAGARHNTSDQKAIQQAHDSLHDGHDQLLYAGAECNDSTVLGYPVRMSASSEAQSPRKEHTFMDEMTSWVRSMPQKVRSLLSGESTFTGETERTNPSPPTPPAPTPPSAPPTPPAPTPPTTPPAVPAEFTARMDGLERELKAERDARFADRVSGLAAIARAEIEALISQGKVYPGEVDTLVASFTQDMVDDLVNPKQVTFSAGTETKQANRADLTRASLRARVPHGLTQEAIPVTIVAFGADNRPERKDVDIRTPDGAEAFARSWATKMNGAGAHRN